MNNELTDLLRSVLKEELEPVNKRLDAIETNGKEHAKRFDAIDQELSEHAKRFDAIDQELSEHVKRFDAIDQELSEHAKRLDVIDQDLEEIKDGQVRLQKNIIESLGEFTEKIVNHFDNKTEALNKRVYAVETEIQRLIKQ